MATWTSREALTALIMARAHDPNTMSFEKLNTEIRRYPHRVLSCSEEDCGCGCGFSSHMLFECPDRLEYLVPATEIERATPSKQLQLKLQPMQSMQSMRPGSA
jgi:hypothetical protein